jgi:AraC-like DNA-binding protein
LTVPYENQRERAEATADAQDPQSKASAPVLRLGALTARLLDWTRETPPDLHLDEVRVFAPLAAARVAMSATHGSDILRAPDVCVVPPGQRLHVRVDPGAEAVLVALDTLVCEERAVRAHGRPARITAVRAGPDAGLREALEDMIPLLRTARPGEQAGARAEDLALHLSNEYAVPDPVTSCAGLTRPRLERVLSMIDERLTQALPVAELAEAVHLSPFHFSRMFRVSVGRSPHEWIMLKRMARAKHLLATTRLALPEVAKGSGYRTHSHFSGMFHAVVGMTPGQYRARHS